MSADRLPLGRRFFVEQALEAVKQVKGEGPDWIHLGVAEAALQHALDHWDEWERMEEVYTKEVADGQKNVGAGANWVDSEVQPGSGGGGAQDVSGGNGNRHHTPEEVAGLVISQDGHGNARGHLLTFPGIAGFMKTRTAWAASLLAFEIMEALLELGGTSLA